MKKALGILLTIIGLIVAFYLLVIVTAWTQETRYEKCFKIILSIFVLVLTFVAGFQTANLRNEGKWKLEQKNNQSGIDLKLPGENEKSIVTVEEVEAKLKGIAELSSYSGEYTVTYGKDTARYWLDNIKIFGTTNSIEIKASGVVKVGYDMSKMVINVDNDSSKIYIKLPEIQLNDNYVIWDTVTCSESNNILNPIEFSQYEEIVDEIERMGLEDVESKGIYDKASENIKNIIKGFLSGYEDYTIIYM